MTTECPSLARLTDNDGKIGKTYPSGGDTVNQEIYCSVNSCHYWDSGNHCKANKIFVVSDSVGDSMPDNFDVMQASTAPATPTDTCMETCCKTFVRKGSPEVNVDGAYKQG